MIELDKKLKVTNYGFKEYIKLYTAVCPYCHKEYTRYVGEREFISGDKKFCSFTCKNRYELETGKKHEGAKRVWRKEQVFQDDVLVTVMLEFYYARSGYYFEDAEMHKANDERIEKAIEKQLNNRRSKRSA